MRKDLNLAMEMAEKAGTRLHLIGQAGPEDIIYGSELASTLSRLGLEGRRPVHMWGWGETIRIVDPHHLIHGLSVSLVT
jgi:hypothetical protein